MNGQSSFDNKLNTTNMSRSYYSFIVFCHEQSSKSASEASALYHLENIDTTGLVARVSSVDFLTQRPSIWSNNPLCME